MSRNTFNGNGPLLGIGVIDRLTDVDTTKCLPWLKGESELLSQKEIVTNTESEWVQLWLYIVDETMQLVGKLPSDTGAVPAATDAGAPSGSLKPFRRTSAKSTSNQVQSRNMSVLVKKVLDHCTFFASKPDSTSQALVTALLTN